MTTRKRLQNLCPCQRLNPLPSALQTTTFLTVYVDTKPVKVYSSTVAILATGNPASVRYKVTQQHKWPAVANSDSQRLYFLRLSGCSTSITVDLDGARRRTQCNTSATTVTTLRTTTRYVDRTPTDTNRKERHTRVTS